VLKTALEERGEYDALMGGGAAAPPQSGIDGDGGKGGGDVSPPAIWRSPDDRSVVRKIHTAEEGPAAPPTTMNIPDETPGVQALPTPPPPDVLSHEEEERMP